MSARRRNNFDVTNTVRISDPLEVCDAVCALVRRQHPDLPLAPIRQAFDTFGRLYAGTLPGYVGCDTWYHDAQHSLDCTLAMARLLDGHEGSVRPALKLGPRRVTLGIVGALFHDAGYIRRVDDHAANGAEYTLTHVRRSGDFLAAFLPTIGYRAEARLASRLVHFTGYEIALDKIRVSHPKDRLLGFMLGSADILAQTADRCYLEKCRDYLFREFSLCGLAGHGHGAVYASARDLLEKTPEFNRKLWDERLDGYFQGVHRYLDAHFGGPNPYVQTIHAHIDRVARLSRQHRLGELKHRPTVIGAQRLRQILASHKRNRSARGPRSRTTALPRYA